MDSAVFSPFSRVTASPLEANDIVNPADFGVATVDKVSSPSQLCNTFSASMSLSHTQSKAEIIGEPAYPAATMRL